MWQHARLEHVVAVPAEKAEAHSTCRISELGACSREGGRRSGGRGEVREGWQLEVGVGWVSEHVSGCNS